MLICDCCGKVLGDFKNGYFKQNYIQLKVEERGYPQSYLHREYCKTCFDEKVWKYLEGLHRDLVKGLHKDLVEGEKDE